MTTRWLLLFVALCSSCPPLHRQRTLHPVEPLIDPDAWETSFRVCAKTFSTAPSCLGLLLTRVPAPLQASFEVEAEAAIDELTRWLDADELLTVYRVKHELLGEWMERRWYILEDSSGNVRLLQISFRRVLGNWWLHAFRLVDRDEIERELGLESVLQK